MLYGGIEIKLALEVQFGDGRRNESLAVGSNGKEGRTVYGFVLSFRSSAKACGYKYFANLNPTAGEARRVIGFPRCPGGAVNLGCGLSGNECRPAICQGKKKGEFDLLEGEGSVSEATSATDVGRNK